MSKNLYIIQDDAGSIGTQLAGSRQRAVMLFLAKNPGLYAGQITAYADNGTDGKDRHPDTWEPEAEKPLPIVRTPKTPR